MKYFIPILLLIACATMFSFSNKVHSVAALKRDTVPSGVPQLFGGKYYKFNGYVLTDSFIMNAPGDTLDFPRYPSLKFKLSEKRWYGHDMQRWQKFLYASDTSTLLATKYDIASNIISANNGLTKTSNTIQLGGTLLGTTTIDAGSTYSLKTTGSLTLGSSTGVFMTENTSTGNGIYSTATTGSGVKGAATSGNAVFGIATTGIGGQFNSTSGFAAIQGYNSGGMGANLTAEPSTTNTTQTVLNLNRGTTGTAANNIGGSIDFRVTTTTTPYQLSNQIVSKLTNATNSSYASQLEFYGASNATVARKAALAATGQWTWDGYSTLTAQVDTSSYKPLGIDVSGNVAKMSGWAATTGPGAPLNSIQYDSAGHFAGDSLQYYPVDNKLLTSQDFIQFGRQGTGFFQDSAWNYAHGYTWMLYPRHSNGYPGQAVDASWGGDTLQPFYSDINNQLYDINQPENPVINIIKFGNYGSYRPMARLALEQDFYHSIEFHFATKPRLMNPNDEIRHWSWTIDDNTGNAHLDTRANQVSYLFSDVTSQYYNRPYFGIGQGGILCQTFGAPNGEIAINHGNSPGKRMGMYVDTASNGGLGYSSLYVSTNTSILTIGASGGATAIDITDPAISTGVISVYKPIDIHGKYFQIGSFPNSAIATQIISSSQGVISKQETDGSGYIKTYNNGAFAIERNGGYTATNRLLYMYNNSNEGDSLFHVRGNGSIWTKGLMVINTLKTTTTAPTTVGKVKDVVCDTNGLLSFKNTPLLYTALITQSSTSNPTATVLGDNTIGAIAWTRSSPGVYTGTLSGAFTSAKTFFVYPPLANGTDNISVNLVRTDANTVTLKVYTGDAGSGFSGTDGLLTDYSIEIRVYP